MISYSFPAILEAMDTQQRGTPALAPLFATPPSATSNVTHNF